MGKMIYLIEVEKKGEENNPHYFKTDEESWTKTLYPKLKEDDTIKSFTVYTLLREQTNQKKGMMNI